jgi:hypothetical protein
VINRRSQPVAKSPSKTVPRRTAGSLSLLTPSLLGLLTLHLVGCSDRPASELPAGSAVQGATESPVVVNPAVVDPMVVDPMAAPAPAGTPAGPTMPAPTDPGLPLMVPPTSPPVSTPPPSSAPHTSPKSIAIYDDTKVVDFHVDFAPGEWERMLAPGAAVEDARWVHCGFQFEGESFPDAACRRKGDVSDWAVERKPQFLVRFNMWDPKGRFHGLRRLHFESFDFLAAPIRDRIGMFAMRAAGLDAPRVNHARVFKNGVELGLYMNVEVIDKEFLEDHFGQADAEGNLWKGGYELHTNESHVDTSRVDALNTLVDREPFGVDHQAFVEALTKMMDVSEVIREMAVETAILVNDNFSNGSTNFYYYEHATRGFVALPWDLDTTFTQSPADADPFEYWAGSTPNKLRQIINETPALRAQYIDALVDVRDKVLSQLPAEIDRVCGQIRPFMPEEPTRAADLAGFEADCAQVAASITARSQALVRLLGR